MPTKGLRGEAREDKMNTIERKLADLVREHPNLYDQSRQDYKDIVKAHSSWKVIADKLEKTAVEVKMKWKNLRDKFCKAKKRMAKRGSPQLTDHENLVERPVPVLLAQLAWLSPYVQPTPGTGVGDTDEGAGCSDDLEKEQDRDEKHGPMPVVSTSFSLMEPSPNFCHEMGVKRKRQTTIGTKTSSEDALRSLRDEDELFLLSLLPSLKRLTIKKRMEVRMKFQQVLYAAEFED